MKHIQRIDIQSASREEILPGFSGDFPYIATCAELDKYLEPTIPWHWHRTVELFYMESGCLEYTTPHGAWLFPAGTGGFLNANVLHSSRVVPGHGANIQLLHLFDPALLSGAHGSRMEEKYILPLVTAPGLECICLNPEEPEQEELLRRIRAAFDLSPEEWGYEFRLREALTEVWLGLLALAGTDKADRRQGSDADDKIKGLMIYVHEHFREPISVEELARAAHVSKRVCFRLFQENLHMTPVEYIRSYRLQRACELLTKDSDSMTQIAYSCGLGSSSYFGKVFRERYGCTPAQYRRKWQDRDRNLQKEDSFSAGLAL